MSARPASKRKNEYKQRTKEQKKGKTALADLPFPRDALRSEAYFNDALHRQEVRDIEGSKRSLQRVIDIGNADSYEYFMALYLLDSPIESQN